MTSFDRSLYVKPWSLLGMHNGVRFSKWAEEGSLVHIYLDTIPGICLVDPSRR